MLANVATMRARRAATCSTTLTARGSSSRAAANTLAASSVAGSRSCSDEPVCPSRRLQLGAGVVAHQRRDAGGGADPVDEVQVAHLPHTAVGTAQQASVVDDARAEPLTGEQRDVAPRVAAVPLPVLGDGGEVRVVVGERGPAVPVVQVHGDVRVHQLPERVVLEDGPTVPVHGGRHPDRRRRARCAGRRPRPPGRRGRLPRSGRADGRRCRPAARRAAPCGRA